MKFIGKIFLVIAFISLNFLAISAQKTPEKKTEDIAALQTAKMKQLDFLVGTWKGEGWIYIGREKKDFTITESFRRLLGGNVVVVEGLGKDKDDKVIHNAYGVFSFDKEKKDVRFRWYKADGEEGETFPEFAKNKMVWKFFVPQYNVSTRFTETINEKGNWLEIGEASRDGGKTWFKFFEMELRKVSD